MMTSGKKREREREERRMKNQQVKNARVKESVAYRQRCPGSDPTGR
jgi:hypothetical protein